jgi:ADP-ribose pyrophosphatase
MIEETKVSNDKPTGALAGWMLQQTQRPLAEKTLTLRQDRVQVGGGGELIYTYVEKAPAVLIVPITCSGEMVLIRQYRYPVDQWCLEIPAGGTHDTGEASLEDVARKELSEEIGATCAALEFVTHFYAEPSLCDEKCHVYLAHGVELNLEPHTESTEEIERVVVSVTEALALAQAGQMKSGPCTLAIFLCQDALVRHGFLTR